MLQSGRFFDLQNFGSPAHYILPYRFRDFLGKYATSVFGFGPSHQVSRGNSEFSRESFISLSFENHVLGKELFPRAIKIFLGKEKNSRETGRFQ